MSIAVDIYHQILCNMHITSSINTRTLFVVSVDAFNMDPWIYMGFSTLDPEDLNVAIQDCPLSGIQLILTISNLGELSTYDMANICLQLWNKYMCGNITMLSFESQAWYSLHVNTDDLLDLMKDTINDVKYLKDKGISFQQHNMLQKNSF